MSKNTRIVIGILAVLVVFVGALGYWANARRAKQTAAAVATVMSAKQEEKKGTDNTILTISYVAGAETVQAKARVTGVHMAEYPAGRSIRICYDPANLQSLRIDDGPCS